MTYYKYTLILFLSFILFGCQQVYYNTLEKVGIHKRNILVDRIEQVQEAQKDGHHRRIRQANTTYIIIYVQYYSIDNVAK